MLLHFKHAWRPHRIRACGRPHPMVRVTSRIYEDHAAVGFYGLVTSWLCVYEWAVPGLAPAATSAIVGLRPASNLSIWRSDGPSHGSHFCFSLQAQKAACRALARAAAVRHCADGSCLGVKLGRQCWLARSGDMRRAFLGAKKAHPAPARSLRHGPIAGDSCLVDVPPGAATQLVVVRQVLDLPQGGDGDFLVPDDPVGYAH
mmetsp:Transcript_3277/g.8157  ORF Transcript_3277/g.8157 Transcript_3277/m.8157 type:complete len:202 (-) Transcript_3277:1317-1922(-)